ncbi:MAG TPA: hypothetical protein VMN36_08095 [Verrucomicrobiales bacterium]|nr:hypothetical protein [Verrucomicrobiales bacterium]
MKTVDGVVVNGGAGNAGKRVQISARELARMGHLFLNKGNWNGKQLISRSWAKRSWRRRKALERTSFPLLCPGLALTPWAHRQCAGHVRHALSLSGAMDAFTGLRFEAMPRSGKHWIGWVLVVAGGLLLATVFWLAWPGKGTGKRFREGALGAGVSAGTAQIESAELRRDHGNAVLRLRVTIDHRNGLEPLRCVAPDVRLTAGAGTAGEEVPAFFLATRPQPAPEVPAGEKASVELLYWLEQRHLQGALALEVRGERVPVKSESAFDLSQLENGKPQPVTLETW